MAVCSGSRKSSKKVIPLQAVVDDVVSKIAKKDDYNIFAEMVSREHFPHYYSVIQKPIALSVIKAKSQRGEYRNLDELKEDFDLMFSNCCFFNPPNSLYHQQAQKLKKVADPLFLKAAPTVDSTTSINGGGPLAIQAQIYVPPPPSSSAATPHRTPNKKSADFDSDDEDDENSVISDTDEDRPIKVQKTGPGRPPSSSRSTGAAAQHTPHHHSFSTQRPSPGVHRHQHQQQPSPARSSASSVAATSTAPASASNLTAALLPPSKSASASGRLVAPSIVPVNVNNRIFKNVGDEEELSTLEKDMLQPFSQWTVAEQWQQWRSAQDAKRANSIAAFAGKAKGLGPPGPISSVDLFSTTILQGGSSQNRPSSLTSSLNGVSEDSKSISPSSSAASASSSALSSQNIDGVSEDSSIARNPYLGVGSYPTSFVHSMSEFLTGVQNSSVFRRIEKIAARDYRLKLGEFPEWKQVQSSVSALSSST